MNLNLGRQRSNSLDLHRGHANGSLYKSAILAQVASRKLQGSFFPRFRIAREFS